ncbi:MAG: hypothetical protein ABIO70_17035 [Pseudomonadota bacterium]
MLPVQRNPTPPPAPARLPDATLVPATEVSEALLQAFLRAAFPDRRTAETWRWQYRVGFRPGREPLAVVHAGRVVALASSMPFDLVMDGAHYRGDWYVDFNTLPEYRGKGLGKWVTRAWMEGTDFGLACGCTPGSRAVFHKCGWREREDSFLHYVFLRPMDHPRLVERVPPIARRALNRAARPAARLAYLPLGARLGEQALRPLDDAFQRLFLAQPEADRGATTHRDAAYFAWRIAAAPERDRYRVVEVGGLTALVKLVDYDGVRSLDLLWLSDPHRHLAVARLMASLARWGLDRGLSFVRLYTSDSALSRALRLSLGSLVRRPVFAWYAADPVLAERFARVRWDWDMLGSDMERI